MNDIASFQNIQKQRAISQINNTQPRRITFTGGVDRVDKVGNTNPIEKPTKMLLSMLKSYISDTPIDMEPFKVANYSDWKTLLDISQEASVSGMALDVAHKMPKNIIPKDIELKLSQIQRESEVRHGQQEKIIGELSEMYAKEGVETIQLKGVGLSMEYPTPKHRFGGDIDIFTRLKGTETTTHSNSYEIVDDLMNRLGHEVEDHNKSKTTKHSEFDYKGVRIENHRYFINKERMRPEVAMLDEILHKNINPRTQILPNGTKILVPSKEFNSIFLAHHAYQHFAFSGIDLHHLTDWGAHIKNNGLDLPPEVKGTHFERFTHALTNLSNRYLGTNVKVPVDTKFEDEIFNKMLHPELPELPEGLNKAEVFVFKMKRFFKNAAKSQEHTGVPIYKAFISAAMNKIKHPSTLSTLFRLK